MFPISDRTELLRLAYSNAAKERFDAAIPVVDERYLSEDELLQFIGVDHGVDRNKILKE